MGEKDVPIKKCADNVLIGKMREAIIVESINMILSGVFRTDGRNFVRISFIRGSDFAEGIVPDGIIEKSEGFTEEEVKELREYMIGNQREIIDQARQINPIRNWLGKSETEEKQ